MGATAITFVMVAQAASIDGGKGGINSRSQTVPNTRVASFGRSVRQRETWPEAGAYCGTFDFLQMDHVPPKNLFEPHARTN